MCQFTVVFPQTFRENCAIACVRACVCVCVNLFVKVPMWWVGSITISLMTAILQMLSHCSQHTANTSTYRWAKTRHTQTNSCTCILMKTFIDTMHSLAPYPKPNHHNWMRNPSWILTLQPNPKTWLSSSPLQVCCKIGLARMSSISKMSSLGSKKHPVLTMQEVKAHAVSMSLYCRFWCSMSFGRTHLPTHTDTPTLLNF